jgi:hypothetical protein
MKPFASSARWLVAVLITIQVQNYTGLVIIRQVEFWRKKRAGNQGSGNQAIRHSFRGTKRNECRPGQIFLIADNENNGLKTLAGQVLQERKGVGKKFPSMKAPNHDNIRTYVQICQGSANFRILIGFT